MNEESRPKAAPKSIDGDQTSSSLHSVDPPAAEVAARRRWAYSLIRRASTPVPSYGSREWLQLPDGTAAKVAAVVVAAESWARELDDLPGQLERELDERRHAEKAAEDAEHRARAAAHRHEWARLSQTGKSFTERRAEQLASVKPRPGDFRGSA